MFACWAICAQIVYVNGTPLQYSCLEKSHGQRSLVGCSPWGCWGWDTTKQLHFHFSLSCTGEGNGNPFQCPCLENPMDRAAGGLPSMGLHRVGHDCCDLAAAAVYANNRVYDEHVFFFGECKALGQPHKCWHDWLSIKLWTSTPSWVSLVGTISYVLSHLETFPFANFKLYHFFL